MTLARAWRSASPASCTQAARRALSGHAVQRFGQTLRFPPATHDIDRLHEVPVAASSPVVLHGYLGAQTVLSKKLCFAPLFSRDLDASVQIVSAINAADEARVRAHAELLRLRPHTPVAVTGVLKERKPRAPSHVGGDVSKVTTRELELHQLQPLNDFPDDIIMTPDDVFPPEQRHLQLRQERPLRDALRLRSEVGRICRNWLIARGFTEIETPLLFKQTPEGAREFIVPTRRRLAYALPQSPQQYKQILMSSGVSRYFQVARCFRDEDLRADRQPEFTQLDLEMSFASGEDVMKLTEDLVTQLWSDTLPGTLPSPFPRLTYDEAMQRFGSDKPDTRLGLEIQRLDYMLPVDLVSKISSLTLPIVEGFNLRLIGDQNPATSRKFITDFLDSAEGGEFNSNPHGAPGIFVYDSSKPLQGLQALGFEAAESVETLFKPEDGDLLVLQARPNAPHAGGATMLGSLRLALHRAAVRAGLIDAATGFAPLWVTDFPLFSPVSDAEPGQGGAAGLTATHHPFTSPRADQMHLLESDPRSVLADHYDLVVNGVELGGGSRRIHNAEMQTYIMENILQMSRERMAEFSHLLEALRAGCPPHAGIALGFDRLVAMLHGTDSIRDVIAFPKSNRGEDLLVRSPTPVSDAVLERYHLKKA